MSISDVNVQQATDPVSRRNVVVGMAFAVPTIMGVGAAPAMAISTSQATFTVRARRTTAKRIRVHITWSGVQGPWSTLILTFTTAN